jgi:hypothetical protein
MYTAKALFSSSICCAAGVFAAASVIGCAGSLKAAEDQPAVTASRTPEAAEAGMRSSESEPRILAVGGECEYEVEMRDGLYVAGPFRIEEKLPEGYPRPTPPGLIEIKHYPSVRRAEVKGTGDPNAGSGFAFFPLFNHIQDRDIAMTSPVEIDYDSMDHDAAGGDDSEHAWRMSFLYRTPDLGPTGEDGNIVVYDTEPVTVVSIGVRGPYGMNTVHRGLAKLDEWFASQNAWERAGTPRSFSYNGPYVPNRLKWSEVQVPVRRAGASVAAGR